MNLSAMFSKMIVLLTAIVIGYLISRRGVIGRDASGVLTSLIVNLTNPLLIVSSVMTGERLLSNSQVLQLTGVAALCYAFLIATSFFVPKLLRAPQKDAGIYRLMYIFSNTGYMGYPVVAALFGPSAVFYATVFVMLFQLLCWSYGVHLVKGDGSRFHFSLSLLKSPCIVAALLAYVFYFTNLRFPPLVVSCVTFLGDITTPLCMLSIGCFLAQIPARAVFTSWRLYVLAGIKMILIPLLAFSVLRLFVTNELILGVTTVILCMPCAANGAIICSRCGVDESLAASAVFMTTLLSMASVPLLMQLMFG